MPDNNIEQHFFFDEQPMRRINNSLNPLQAINIIDKAKEECKDNPELISDLEKLKEWIKSRN